MNDATLCRRTIPSPLGPILLVAGERGLKAVHFGGDPPSAASGASPILDEAARQLAEYFAGDRQEFDLPLDPDGTPFQQAAWAVLRTIPYGRTLSYGEQAARLGDPNKARAVGAANGGNPLAIVVPCHRVVGAGGRLTGYAGGLPIKAWLLEHEQGGARQAALPMEAMAGIPEVHG
jgi:methylated-DNA-[protein]-cysteine S-methyltransferase